jgi:hypothetical protein
MASREDGGIAPGGGGPAGAGRGLPWSKTKGRLACTAGRREGEGGWGGLSEGRRCEDARAALPWAALPWAALPWAAQPWAALLWAGTGRVPGWREPRHRGPRYLDAEAPGPSSCVRPPRSRRSRPRADQRTVDRTRISGQWTCPSSLVPLASPPLVALAKDRSPTARLGTSPAPVQRPFISTPASLKTRYLVGPGPGPGSGPTEPFSKFSSPRPGPLRRPGRARTAPSAAGPSTRRRERWVGRGLWAGARPRARRPAWQ